MVLAVSVTVVIKRVVLLVSGTEFVVLEAFLVLKVSAAVVVVIPG